MKIYADTKLCLSLLFSLLCIARVDCTHFYMIVQVTNTQQNTDTKFVCSALRPVTGNGDKHLVVVKATKIGAQQEHQSKDIQTIKEIEKYLQSYDFDEMEQVGYNITIWIRLALDDFVSEWSQLKNFNVVQSQMLLTLKYESITTCNDGSVDRIFNVGYTDDIKVETKVEECFVAIRIHGKTEEVNGKLCSITAPEGKRLKFNSLLTIDLNKKINREKIVDKNCAIFIAIQKNKTPLETDWRRISKYNLYISNASSKASIGLRTRPTVVTIKLESKSVDTAKKVIIFSEGYILEKYNKIILTGATKLLSIDQHTRTNSDKQQTQTKSDKQHTQTKKQNLAFWKEVLSSFFEKPNVYIQYKHWEEDKVVYEIGWRKVKDEGDQISFEYTLSQGKSKSIP